MAAQRYVQGTLTAGTQTAVLGLESIKPHELIAVAVSEPVEPSGSVEPSGAIAEHLAPRKRRC